MPLNDEQLSGAFYKNFYYETLYVLPENQNSEQSLEESPAVSESSSQPAFAISGENRKGLAIITKLPARQAAALPQNEFLVNILKAIQFSIPDVLFVNVLQDDAALEDLSQVAEYRFLLVFGENVLKMPVSGKYQPDLAAAKPVVLADALSEIETNTDLKRNLWAALKQVFLG